MAHSLLSATVIREMLGKGVIIDPFDLKRLKTVSYDVGLGDCYHRRKGAAESGDYFFNPYDPEMVKRHYGEPQYAKPASHFSQFRCGAWKNIRPDHKIIILEPGEMILAHTVEFIGGTKDPESGRCFTAEMKARSSAGRVGLEVCRCAGWGDVGYVNRWTMEVVCTSPVPTVLIAFTPLAQMKFYEVDPLEWEELYGADSDRDHYQSGINLDELKARWAPEMMLPRLKPPD